MRKKLRIGVLFGGRSTEHEVSLESARNVIAAIDPQKFEVIPIRISKEGRWRVGVLPPGSSLPGAVDGLPKGGIDVIPAASPGLPGPLVPLPRENAGAQLGPLDVVFPVLHGTFGEDGAVQGLLELAGVAYVGAGVLGSALGMDKEVQKRLLMERKLPVVPYLCFLRSDMEGNFSGACAAVEKKFRYPVFVKPANQGSSVGVGKARNRRELQKALGSAADYDRKVMVEKAVEGREIEVSVLGNDHPVASVPGEVVPGGEFYDYSAKYLEDTSQLLVPAPLRAAQTKQVQRLAVEAFRAIDCAGMARVDFFLEKRSGKFYINELNTIPGFTAISMYPRLWEASGLSYSKLIERLIELALEQHREKARTRYCLLPAGRAS
jgi:D-alanine-D-alanine ligase